MNIVTELTRIYFLVIILLYTLEAYLYFGKKSERSKSRGLGVQIALLTMFSIGGFGVIFYHHHQWIVLLFLAGVLSYNTLTLVLFSSFYPKCSMLLLSNMLMLLNIGFVILARLDFDKAMKQGIIVGAGTILALLVPVMIRKLRVLEKLQILYAILGIGALMGVLALAVTSRGAKLSITVAGITIQFSEIVKITFVFYMAARLAKDRSFRSVVVTSVVAALHVGILVFSTDLGTRPCPATSHRLEGSICRVRNVRLPDRAGTFRHRRGRVVWHGTLRGQADHDPRRRKGFRVRGHLRGIWKHLWHLPSFNMYEHLFADLYDFAQAPQPLLQIGRHRPWCGVRVSGVPDGRRRHEIYPDDGHHPAARKLWRELCD